MGGGADVERGYGSRGCIVCGRQNSHGLGASFRPAPGGAWAEVTAPPHLQGFDGLLHGGLVAGLLDDAMWYAAYFQGLFTMTGQLSVRYRKPVPTGVRLRVEGRVVAQRHRLAQAEARLMAAESGEVLAEAEGKFVAVPPEVRARLSPEDAIGPC